MHPVKESAFGAVRGFCFFSGLDLTQGWWCIKNHDKLTQTPAYWISSPSLAKHYPVALEVLDSYRIYKKITNFRKLKSYLVKKIESAGTCHAQCLVMLEQMKTYPNRIPAALVANIDKTRLMYFQTVEYIRGDCRELFKECVALLPEAGSRSEVKYKGRFKEWREKLTAPQNCAYIIRFWDPKNKISHSMLYVIRDRAFWFYDSDWVGLYSYSSPRKLFEGFYSHLKAFSPRSYHDKTMLLVEEYPL